MCVNNNLICCLCSHFYRVIMMLKKETSKNFIICNLCWKLRVIKRYPVTMENIKKLNKLFCVIGVHFMTFTGEVSRVLKVILALSKLNVLYSNL